jgi:three-Cys-motif partner protein
VTVEGFCAAACGAILDCDDPICRVCGEDNGVSTSGDWLEITPEVEAQLDRLHPWSQVKHEIIEKYLHAYTTILRNQSGIRRYVYIDAFAGAGVAVDAASEQRIAAGAARALEGEPRFTEYHFIEQNPEKASVLREVAGRRRNVTVHVGDSRAVLPHLLERCRYQDRARGLCLLDPYGLSVEYALLQSIAAMDHQLVEIFFNFMLVGANRNVLWRMDPSQISPARAALMTRVWGDESWREQLYRRSRQDTLFGEPEFEKVTNPEVAEAYRARLRAAGFSFVPEPVAMKTATNAALYYLYFCSGKSTANKIVDQIFARHR